MANMVKIEKETPEDMAVGMNEPRYPWGTQLDFEDDLVDELEIGNLAVGDKVLVVGEAKVKSTRMADDEGDGERKAVCVQLTEVSVRRASPNPDRAAALYGDD